MENKLPIGTLEADAEEDLVVHIGDYDNGQHHSVSNASEMVNIEDKTKVVNSV